MSVRSQKTIAHTTTRRHAQGANKKTNHQTHTTHISIDSNGSQFYITTSETAWLDEKCVVIGAVTDQASLDTISLVERLGTEWGAPKRPVFISDCGQSNFK